MHGPAVTTGAPLPYTEKATKNLGPPRAFHAPRNSVPMITLSSSLKTEAKVTQELDDGQNALPQTPFAQQHTSQAGKKTDGRSAGAERKQQSLRAAYGPPTQGSLQSCESSSSTEVRLLSLAPGPQTVTTAQNIQGVTGSSAAIVRHSSLPESQLLHLSYGRGFGGAVGLATTDDRSGSLGTAVTTGHTAPSAHSPATEAQRRGGLRKHLKRKAVEDAARVEADCGPHEGGQAACGAPDRQQSRRRQRAHETAGGSSRERRELEIQEAYDKIASLEEEQTQWRERCLGIENACSRLHGELQAAGRLCAAADAENRRLLAELKYLRLNAGLGSAQEHTADENSALMDLPQWNWGVEHPCSVSSPANSGDAFFDDFVEPHCSLL